MENKSENQSPINYFDSLNIANDIYNEIEKKYKIDRNDIKKSIFLMNHHNYFDNKMLLNEDDLIIYEKRLKNSDEIAITDLYEFICSQIGTSQIASAIRKENNPDVVFTYQPATIMLYDFIKKQDTYDQWLKENSFILNEKNIGGFLTEDIKILSGDFLTFKESEFFHLLPNILLDKTNKLYESSHFSGILALIENYKPINEYIEFIRLNTDSVISIYELIYIYIKIYTILKKGTHMVEFPFAFGVFINKWINNKIPLVISMKICRFIIDVYLFSNKLN